MPGGKPKINSRRKGINAEQVVARYLVARGLPDARRSVATGWRNDSTEHADRGDIDGVAGFTIQVKNTAKPLTGQRLADVWRETLSQALPSLSVPLLLEKRAGSADVGRWWLYLDSPTYVRLVTGEWRWTKDMHLVRVELRDVVDDIVLMSRELSSDKR